MHTYIIQIKNLKEKIVHIKKKIAKYVNICIYKYIYIS